MAMAYIVTTPNPVFNGKVFGVQFFGGRALVDEATIDPALHRTVNEIATLMERDFGYTVSAQKRTRKNEVKK